MRICLDVRYTTRSGASTVIDAFLQHLPAGVGDCTITLVSHRDRSANEWAQVNVPYRNRMLEFQWSQTMLPRQLKTGNYDIYHSLKHVGPMRCPIRSIYRVPAVGQFVGQYPQKLLDQIYWGHAAKHVYRQADCLIAVSDYIRRGLIEYLQVPDDRVRTIHNGVDRRFRRIEEHDGVNGQSGNDVLERPFLLCVANVVPVKNLQSAIEALAQLRDKELRLVIAGNDDTVHARQLKQLVNRLKLDARVRFIGRQTVQQLLELYNRAELLLHPSFHEGLSSTLLEAMACGLPIIAANTTSIPETTQEAAVYHDASDTQQLAAEIERVIGDRELRADMSRMGQARAGKFSWKRCVEKTIALYQELDQ